MNLVVNPDLKAYIDPLTPEEHEALERSLLTEGCRDALVLWGDVLVDGHNRYGICQQHGLPFQTVQNPRFQSLEDVHLWMIDQHLGRRSVSNFQCGLLALRKSEILAERATLALASRGTEATDAASHASHASPLGAPASTTAPAPERLNSRDAIARAARLSSGQVVMIEKIQKQATAEVVAAVRAGTISINAAAALSTLPADQQVAAAAAGADELKQAAKRVREAKRPPRDAAAQAPDATSAQGAKVGNAGDAGADALQALRQRVAQLTEENAGLRRQLAELQASMAG